MPADAGPVDSSGVLRLTHIATDPTSLSFLRGQVTFMQAHGLAVTAVTSPGDYLQSFAQREGVEVAAVEMPRRITPFRDLVAVAQLVAALRRMRPHIVHAQTPKGGLLGMMAAAVCRVPVRIYHIRGLPMLGAAGMKRRLLWLTELVACRLAHRVLCVSHSMRDIAIASRLARPDDLVVLAHGSGNGVDAAGRFVPPASPDTRLATRRRYGIPDDALVIGFVGRLVRDKGVAELAEAWAALRERLPDAHLLLVGRAESQDALPPGVQRGLDEDPRVHLTGLDWDTPPLYAAMDVVALPTYREGFPNVALEAAAMALPIVATRVPGCTDAVIDGVTGTLVEARDARNLAAALEAYARDSRLREAHGGAARRRVLEQFDPRAIWRALHGQYIDLAERHVAGSARSALRHFHSSEERAAPTAPAATSDAH